MEDQNLSEDELELFKAAKNGDKSKVQELLDKDINVMCWKHPSLLMVAFEYEEENDLTEMIINYLYHKLRDVASADDQETVDSIVGHLMSEIKYEADRVENAGDDDKIENLDLAIDIIAEELIKIHAEYEDAIESALVKAAKEGDGPDHACFNKWPLLIAAGCGFAKCVSQVWNILEDDEDGEVIYETDLFGNNCLLRAIEEKQRGVVKVILKMDNKEAIFRLMKLCFYGKRSIFGLTYSTPLRMLIKYMPDMAKLFLDLCVQKKGTKKTKYMHKYIDDHEWATEQLSKSDQDKSESVWAKVKKLFQSNRPQPENHVLNCIVENDRLKLLKHPLISKWIEQKWKSAQVIYVLLFILYSCFISFLTAYSLITPNPALTSICNNTSFDFYDTFDVPPNSTINLNCTYQFGGAIIIIILAGLHLMFEIMQVVQHRLHYFRDWENYLELFIFTGSIVFTSNFERQCHCIDESRWQLGAFVLFCGWLNFIVLLKDYPTIGAPINLLFNICYKYIKLVYLPILLMISFALPFYMVFVINDNGMNSIDRFSRPSWSLLSYWVGQTGDTGFSDVFLGAPLPYIPTAVILFVIFLIVVPVLFNNMLIGLAVGDVSAAYEQADLNTIASQVKYIIYVDDAFPMLKVHLKELEDGVTGCKCPDLPKMFQGSGKHDDTDADTEDTVGKEDLLALEDKVMKELDGVNEKLDNLHNILKAIQKR
eukprot:Em0017g848a